MPGTLVLGLGNPLMGDDGMGVAAVERLRETWEVPAGVDLVDGGTWGMNLLPMIEAADRVILVDAIRSGADPGTVTVLERPDLPRYFTHKLSPHQIDIREVLTVAELRGSLPAEVVAIGIEPDLVEMMFGLSRTVEAGVDRVIDLVIARLEAAGHACRRRVVAAPCTS